MPEHFVSICIPVYNGEKFLAQCIESCLAQNYRNFEVVVCDDCSTDTSEKIVRDFMQNEPRIKFFRNEKNLGLVGNWNNSIHYARGTWIKMLFQDDYLAPECLHRFMEAAGTDADLLVSRRNFVFDYEPGESEKKHYRLKNRQFDKWSQRKVTRFTPRQIAATAARNININFIAEPSLTLFRKEAALHIGLFDNEFLQVCDLDFLLRLSGEKGLIYLPYDLCFFRLHAEATTNVNMSTRAFELRYLEPLLMAARFITHRSYSTLKQQLGLAEKFRIRLYLNTRFLEAMLVSKKSGKDNTLASYLATHPSISALARPNLLHKVIYRVLQLKRAVRSFGRKD